MTLGEAPDRQETVAGAPGSGAGAGGSGVPTSAADPTARADELRDLITHHAELYYNAEPELPDAD
ncbi:MAG: hypothetical protein ACRD0B_13050, partial [Acidimicrobiales bacterium]